MNKYLSCCSNLQKRYQNRHIVEFQIAAEEQMKITEIRLAKLFSEKENSISGGDADLVKAAKKSEGTQYIQFFAAAYLKM